MLGRTRKLSPHRRPFARFTAALLTALVALAPLSGPAPAFARKAASDAVAGAPLAKGGFPSALAPDVDARAGVLVTGDGRVLWARNGNERRPMASTTKMMTALLTIEHGDLDRVVTVSRAAAGVPYASGLKAGQRVTVRQLLQLALVASSNDAAYALAESVSGNMPAFVKRMNERAASLRLRDTHYVNPHGLDEAGHYSSAADLATLARTVMELPDFRRTVSMRGVSLNGVALKSTDELLGSYVGANGVKTGTTDRAGYCFVGSAQRGGTWLIAVVLAAPSDTGRFTQARTLLDWGFRNLVQRTLASKGEAFGAVRVAGTSRDVTTSIGETVARPVLGAAPVSREASVVPRVALPVFAGQPLGEVRFVQGATVLATAPLVAATSLASVGETVGAVPVSDYLDRAVTARAADASVSPFDPAKPVSRRVQVAPKVEAPVAKGQRLGDIVYSQGGRVVARVPVVAAESAEEPGLLAVLSISLTRGWRAVFGGPAMASLRLSD